MRYTVTIDTIEIYYTIAVSYTHLDVYKRQFKDNWDWHALSGNQNLQLSCQDLEKYADSMDWEKIISRWDCKLFDESGIDFYEKFREYIPASKLQGSYLWDEMVEQQKKSLIRKIIS